MSQIERNNVLDLTFEWVVLHGQVALQKGWGGMGH